ncbi:uncharacterized protein LOC132166233 [Corylus avellana]|uniref:uncharacterized protein LOC132166233 n=1 Tax=Corylus avellana TaxID=13451 RepID=UPI00286B5451|nr:uncharacterized protein LOC132166233 [Corylus avellana]
MTSRKDYVVYAPLPPNPNTTAQNVIVLPLYHPPPSKRRRICQFLTSFTALLLVSLTVYFLYPSDPTVQLVRLRLNNIGVKSSPQLTLDLSFSLTVKVRNRDLFSFDYQSMAVSVGYRGRELGIVNSDGGRVRARGLSYVNATLDLNGFEVIHDVFYLLEDLAKGVIPFDTVTEVNGALGFFFVNIPLKARLSCEVYVNTNNQTIVHQDCYPG